MKMFRCWASGGRFLLLSVAISAGAGKLLAQDSNTISVVTVQATQPFATLANPGVFTVFRAGNTNAALNVWYELGGTASNGVDYTTIPPHLVAIAAGATSSTIVITPVPTPPASPLAKTVVLTLTNSPLMTPVNYEIGSPSSAVVYLGSTNFPPPVVITTPKDGAVFYTPTNILIGASFGYFGSPPPTNIEFFAGTNDLGKGLFGVSSGFGGSTYLTWGNPPPGGYALAAVASYVNFGSTTSAPVHITVLQGPVTNLPPVVSLIAPTNGAVFYTPANIQLLASASDPDGSISNVEFFAGTNNLGRGSPVVLEPPGANGVTGLVYLFVWLNPPPGAYPLTAVATDNRGLSTTSATVNITVLPGPTTNLPPLVRITSPPNGEVFRAPVSIPIYAFAVDPTGIVASVEFFAASNSIGLGHRVTAAPPPLPPGNIQPPILVVVSNYWELTWTNPPPATNISLTAKATDNGGASTISPPVNISVLPPLPTPTNRPALVSIVATDPLAIEGTNCWRWPVWSNWVAPTAVTRFITNCGPKNATFTIFRAGATNDNLNVNYLIGGTASNGVAYVALPGVVPILAGQWQAEISIVPLDDGPPDVTRTVVLRLAPGTNYVIGVPASAAAIILDSQTPQTATGVLPGNLFHLSAAGPDGAWFGVQYSTDLVHWTPICTNQVVNGGIDFVDPDAASQPARYYRTVPEAGPPAP